MDSAIVFSFVAGKADSLDGASSGIVSVQASGPSGYWRFSRVTEPGSLLWQIRELTAWKDLATRDSGVSAEDEELETFSALESGFEVALMSTPKGFAIEAREVDC